MRTAKACASSRRTMQRALSVTVAPKALSARYLMLTSYSPPSCKVTGHCVLLSHEADRGLWSCRRTDVMQAARARLSNRDWLSAPDCSKPPPSQASARNGTAITQPRTASTFIIRAACPHYDSASSSIGMIASGLVSASPSR